MVEMVLHFVHVDLNLGDLVHGGLDVELGDFTHRLLAEREHVVAGDLLTEERTVGVECTLNAVDLHVPGVGILLQLLIDALFEEDLL